MSIQNVSNNSVIKSAGIGAAVGACVGLPKVCSGIKYLNHLNKISQDASKNSIISSNLADTFKKMTQNGVISFSETDAQKISGLMERHIDVKNAAEGIKSVFDATLNDSKKIFKKDIKTGVLISLAGAAIGATTFAIINKVKQNKQVQE